jgi:hypothetical protein
MNEHEINRRAEELNALLDGQPTDLPAEDTQLAEDLVNLSSQLQPDLDFSRELARRLEAARPQHKSTTFWQTLLSRRVLLPLASAAIAVWFILFGLPRINSLTPASIPKSTPAVSINNLTQPAEMKPSVPVILPALPLLGPSRAQAATNLSDLFPKADWILQATLPEGPVEATVYGVEASDSFTLETGKTIAARLGVKGEVFAIQRSEQPSLLEYFVVDGLTRLDIYDVEKFTLIPDITLTRNEHSQPLPFEQLATRAEAFLKEKGLLDFDYIVQPSWLRTDEVIFTRMLDGYPLLGGSPQQINISVSVEPDGNIRQVNYQGLHLHLEPAGRYPLRSAADAWQGLLTGQLSGRFGYQVMSVLPPFQPLHWSSKFEVGQRADLYGQVMVYKPLDTSRPLLVTVEDIPIQGDFKGLENSNDFIHVWGTVQAGSRGLELALEGWETPPVPNTYFGTLEKDGETLVLAALDGRHYELVAPPDNLPIGEPAMVNGMLSSDSSRMEWGTIDAGRKICQTYTTSYIYSNSSGGGRGGGGGGGGGGAPPELCIRYGNTKAIVIAGGFDNFQPPSAESVPSATPIVALPQPGDQFTAHFEAASQPSLADLIQGSAKVEKVSLVYLTTGFEDAPLTQNDLSRYIQPLWSFSGHLEDGREFNIFVQAVQDEYLK